jgi:tetratricopeptide (TPR) repeat protein
MLSIFTKSNFFDTVAKYALGATIFLLPLMFSGSALLSSASSKVLVLFVLVTIASIAHTVARVIDRKVLLPNTVSLVAMCSVPVVFVLSALFTGRFTDSFVGYGSESTTVVAILLLTLLALVTSIYARDTRVVVKGMQLAVVSFGIVLLYQVIRLFVPATMLTFGAFSGPFASPLGGWNDVAMYIAIALIALFVLARQASKKSLYFIVPFAALLLVFLNVISFTLIWGLLAVLALIIVCADSVENKKITLLQKNGFTLYRSIGLCFVVLVIIYTVVVMQSVRVNSQGSLLRPNLYKIVNTLPLAFGGTPDAVRPSAGVTAKIYAKTVQANPLFGAGPNRFSEVWAKYKPLQIFQTQFWNSDFLFGFGYIPTLMITTGLLGTISILLLLAYTLLGASKIALGTSSSKVDKILAYSTAFLLICSVIYLPSFTLLAYLFIGIGYIFSKTKPIEIMLKSKKSAALLYAKLALSIVFFAALGMLLGREYVALASYAKAARSISIEKNIDAADGHMTKAIKTSGHDLYYREYANLALLKSQVIVSQATQNNVKLSDEARQAAISQIDIAKKYAEAAIARNPLNHSNYTFAASVYESGPSMPEKTIDLYNKAMVYNPEYPDAYFGIARVKAVGGDLKATREYIQKTLSVRPGHTNALLAAAQLTAQEKDVEGTIQLLAQAYRSDASRSDILMNIANIQLDAQKNAAAATQTLEIAVSRNPNYIEGRYGLAILYARAGKYVDAANLLVGVIKIDEKTKEALDPIIVKLRAGTDPFTQAAPTTKTATSTPTTKTTSTKVKK